MLRRPDGDHLQRQGGRARDKDRNRNDLEQKALRYPNPKNHTLRRHAFVRRFRGRAPDGVLVHRLADLG